MLPPRSTKLNGAVERAQRKHTEEFYELRPFDSFTVEGLNREIRAWERVYNTSAPHQESATSPASVPARRTPRSFVLNEYTGLPCQLNHGS